MGRRLKVFVVTLFAAAFFCPSVFADFSINDSQTLRNIEMVTRNLDRNLYIATNNLNDIHSRLVAISNNLDANFGSLLSDTTSIQSQLTSVQSILSSILGRLGESSYKVDDRNAVYAFDTRYFYSSQESSAYEGMIFSGSPAVAFNPSASGRYLAFFLEPGKYVLEANCSNNAYLSSFGFEANSSSPNTSLSGTFESIGTFDNISKFRAYFTVDSYLTFSNLAIQANTSGYWVNAYLYLVEGSSSVVSDNLKPSIDSHGQQLDQGIDQMEDLENTAFGNLDTSIGSLDFSGSALGQVVSGFTFIRAVFSAVYSSSPYISVLINLSCMLGVLALFLRVQPRFSRWEREHRDRTS